jgi:hypothetical protein
VLCRLFVSASLGLLGCVCCVSAVGLCPWIPLLLLLLFLRLLRRRPCLPGVSGVGFVWSPVVLCFQRQIDLLDVWVVVCSLVRVL